MSYIKAATGNKFVVIIDEWDVLIRDEAQNHKLQEKHIDFLRGMFKGTEPSKYCVSIFDRNSADQEIKDTVRSQQF